MCRKDELRRNLLILEKRYAILINKGVHPRRTIDLQDAIRQVRRMLDEEVKNEVARR